MRQRGSSEKPLLLKMRAVAAISSSRIKSRDGGSPFPFFTRRASLSDCESEHRLPLSETPFQLSPQSSSSQKGSSHQHNSREY